MNPDPVCREIERLEALAVWLDGRFRVPGTAFRFGLDGLIGLIPWVGDTATAAAGLYLVWRASRLGLPRPIVARMISNVAIDWLAGGVPLVGDVFDFAFKAHRRNVQLLRAAFAARCPPAGPLKKDRG